MAKLKAVLAPRPAPDPAAVEAFLAGKPSPSPEALEAPWPKASALPTGRVVLERKDGRKLRRTTVYLPVELAKRVGIYAVTHGVDQTQVHLAALEAWLSTHDG